MTSRQQKSSTPPSTPRVFPIIAGPTAGGKSDLAVAVALAQRESGKAAEIVTADAFQVYRGMDIGTAKPPAEERRGVPHHLIDIVEPNDPRGFTVDDWLKRAEETIAALRGRGVVPIVVGGTHLYIKALLDGLFEGPEPDAALRAELAAMEAGARRAELERVDPAAAARIHPNDSRRTIRALEVFRLTGKPISSLQKQWDQPPKSEIPNPKSLLVILDWETEALNRRINARVKQLMDRGLFDEVAALHRAGRLGPQAAEALGYKQLIPVVMGNASLDDAVEKIKIETRRFAKNQRTWLRRLRARPGTLVVPMPATGTDAALRTVIAEMLRTA